MKIITMVPYLWTIDQKIVNLTTSFSDFSQVVFFSQKMLKEGFPGYEDMVESKFQIIINNYDPDYLIVYTESSEATKEEIKEMLDIMINNEQIFSIGKWGAYWTPDGSICQDQFLDKNDCSGRPGIFRISIWKQFADQAAYDCYRRCGSLGEFVTHVGYLAKRAGYENILYSPYLKFGHLTKKDAASREDYCIKCNAHSVALNQPCISKNHLSFDKVEPINLEKITILKNVGPPKPFYCSGCERAKEIGVRTFGVQHIEGCPFREPEISRN